MVVKRGSGGIAGGGGGSWGAGGRGGRTLGGCCMLRWGRVVCKKEDGEAMGGLRGLDPGWWLWKREWAGLGGRGRGKGLCETENEGRGVRG